MEQAMVTAILVCAGASFFFALAETALFSLSNWQVGQLVEKHPFAGKFVARLLARPQDLLATLALGNTFTNAAILAAALRQMCIRDRMRNGRNFLRTKTSASRTKAVPNNAAGGG